MSIWGRVGKKALGLSFLTLLLALGACSSASSRDDLGEELCAIYGAALSENIDDKDKALYRAEKVSKEIEQKLPDYYNKHHVNIVAAAPGDQYDLAKTAVKYESGSDWDCPAMKRYLGME
ncbi:hypothetical protein [Marinimicrobium locisalis]|uniref:hypothetical protein n=1 Tax=Marinimicrobium locisalis TaxID=546022 RepID=UPI003221D5E6